MNTITKDDVDLQWKKITGFEKLIPGIRYGEDYPQFALAIVGSQSFNEMVGNATMLGLMSAVLLPERFKDAPAPEDKKKLLEDLAKESPMREAILRALYLGYKLGKGT